jgi:hypothetical protein
MSVNLIYQQTGYRFQISQFTPLTFIYDVACKVFQISHNIHIYYKDQLVPNEQIYSSNFFKKFPVTLNIVEIKKTTQQNQSSKNKNSDATHSSLSLPETNRPKKKNFIKCQICLKKNSIFYCRNCNQFVCFECNIRYPEHFNHQKVNLESGDIFLCSEEYKNTVLGLLNELNSAYKFSSGNIYSEQKREEIFDDLMDGMEDLDKKTQTLTIMGTSYKCNNELLSNYNKEIKEIAAPKINDEIVDRFTLVNDKELEINHYVGFINLQIIKSEFNLKMDIFIKKAKKIIEEMKSEINHKLNDSMNLKTKDYETIISYNNKKYKEQNSSSDSDSNSSSSTSKKSSETSSSDESNNINYANNNNTNNNANNNEIKLNSENNKVNNRMNKRRSIYERRKSISDNRNSIFEQRQIANDHEIDVKKLMVRKNENIAKIFNTINTTNNKKFENSTNFDHSYTIKEDANEYKDMDNEENLTLPKINNSNKKIKNNKKILLSPIDQEEKKVIDLKNIKTIQKSIKNIMQRNKVKNNENDSINKIDKNHTYKNIKIFKEDKLLSKVDLEKEKDFKILQNNNKFVVNLMESYKGNNIRKNNMSTDNKKNSLSIGNDNGMKSFDENMRNRLVNSLKKVKLSKKLKLYDTYKNKEDEEENINNVTDYSSIMNLKKNQNENKKSPIKKKK